MNELLERFREPAATVDLFPDKPATIGNLIRLAVDNGWLASAIPFGRQLRGPDSIWKETLTLTESGRQAIR